MFEADKRLFFAKLGIFMSSAGFTSSNFGADG
jgi:hypothetical protein